MRFIVVALLLFALPAERSSVPLGLDAYRPVPETNPLTPEKIALGRRLFFDRRLSRDGTIACANCHDPRRAFTDARRVAVGIGGRLGTRNVPTLINRVYGRSQFLDGRAESLEQQVLEPIQNPSRTAPYMHDGTVPTLEAVVDFYDAGGRPNPNLDPEIHPLRLTVEEKRALVRFLKSLSGTVREGQP